MSIKSKVHIVCSVFLFLHFNAQAQVDLPQESGQGEEEYTPPTQPEERKTRATASKGTGVPTDEGEVAPAISDEAPASTDPNPIIDEEGATIGEDLEVESKPTSTSSKGYVWFGAVFVVLLVLIFALT